MIIIAPAPERPSFSAGALCDDEIGKAGGHARHHFGGNRTGGSISSSASCYQSEPFRDRRPRAVVRESLCWLRSLKRRRRSRWPASAASSDPVQPQGRLNRHPFREKTEEMMVSRLVPGSALAAIAGAAMFVAASSSPSPAFTLSSPALEQSVLGADIQDVYWCRWGRCGRWGWHRWGYPHSWHRWGWYHPYYCRPYYHPSRRCWWGPWGYRCHWY